MMGGLRKKRVMGVVGASLGRAGGSGSFVFLFGRREIIVFGKISWVVGIGKVDLILVLVIANAEEVHSRSSFYTYSALLYH